MPFVNEIEESHASPPLRELYGKIDHDFGFLPHYFKSLGTMPDVIDAQLRLSPAILNDGALSHTVKEQIGVAVSGINSSMYCVSIHMELLRRFGVEKPLARKLATDYENAPVEANIKALFRFSDKLTRTPMDIQQSDIETLKAAGWDDAAVRETVLTVAYFNFVNRVSLGLGLVEEF
jgi:uncharacterized peroxidase-related enzyme